ncbi:MAG: DUF3460 family protein [Burkholderiaceae bacterium]|nr:DUF3460 family protein [Gammaproteobacteria bacterium]
MYVSEITRFLNELKAKQPEIAEQQREGRALWWDKSLDLEVQARFRDSRVAQSPYVYQPRS